MTASKSTTVLRAVRGVTLGGGLLGAALLAVQAASPLDGTPSAPAWLNWSCAVLTISMLAWFARFGKRDERAMAGFVALPLGYFLWVTKAWTVHSAPEFASVSAQTLSTTWNGLALLALLTGWALLALGVLVGRAALCLSDEPESVGVRTGAWTIGVIVTSFGVRGLIGYASGNLSLLIT